jgi:hypothetical protein
MSKSSYGRGQSMLTMINKDNIHKQSMLTNFLEEELSSKQSKPVLLKSFDKFDFFPKIKIDSKISRNGFYGSKSIQPREYLVK